MQRHVGANWVSEAVREPVYQAVSGLFLDYF